MNTLAPTSVDEFELLGDEARSAGQWEQALDHYERAEGLVFERFDLAMRQPGDLDEVVRTADVLNRVVRKVCEAMHALQPPPPSAAERVAELRAALEWSVESGYLAHAAGVAVDLGSALAELDDRDGAESAYRQAVAFARQVDADQPDLMLWAFRSLIDFLAPSEESITLAEEMADNLIDRREMFHPMRAAEAAYHWAVAELRFTEVAQHRVEHAVDGIARRAVEALDCVCLHDMSQALQYQVADVLGRLGRDAEADLWQAEADKYGDCSEFMENQIPGHVHLWDIHIDVPDPHG